MSTETHGIADDQVRSAFQHWKNLEEDKARIGDDLKELFAEQKAFGHDTKAMRAAFRLKVKMDEARPEDAEHEALVDTYLAALEAPRASRACARENIEKIDRDERRRRRTTEAMDDHKSLVDEMADAGLISEEARHENKALADAVATKFGNGPAMALRSDGGLSIFTKHEDIRTSDGSPSVSSSLTTREAEESVVSNSAGSSSGKASDFGSEDAGSIPAPASSSDQYGEGGADEVMSSAPCAGNETQTPNTGEGEASAALPDEFVEEVPPTPMKRLHYAHCFPELTKAEYGRLEFSIIGIGVSKPIIRMGDVIVDGWARYNICRTLGISYPITNYSGNDVLLDVIGWQRVSRNFTPAQEKKIAADLAKEIPHRADEIMAAFGLAEALEAAE